MTETMPNEDSEEFPRSVSTSLPVLRCGWVKRRFEIRNHVFRVIVPDNPDALLDDASVRTASRQDDYMPYWAYLWPAALLMAESILDPDAPGLTSSPEQARVLELGCGLGLAGLAALSLGYHVSLTDYDTSAVAVAQQNAILNGYTQFDAFRLDWRKPQPRTYDVIMGCDVLYERRNIPAIIGLLDVMLNVNGVCCLGEVGRPAADDFVTTAEAHGFHVSIRKSATAGTQPTAADFRIYALTRSGHDVVSN